MKLVKIGTGIVAATLLVSAQETQKHIDEKRKQNERIRIIFLRALPDRYKIC